MNNCVFVKKCRLNKLGVGSFCFSLLYFGLGALIAILNQRFICFLPLMVELNIGISIGGWPLQWINNITVLSHTETLVPSAE